MTETRKLILQNTLEDELKTHFRLISQDRFEEAREKAFVELAQDPELFSHLSRRHKELKHQKRLKKGKHYASL